VLLRYIWWSLLLLVVIRVAANALPQACGQDRLPAASSSSSAPAASRCNTLQRQQQTTQKANQLLRIG
jgi:hypothetical protein